MNKILLFIGLIFILALHEVASIKVITEKVQTVEGGITPFQIAKCLNDALKLNRDIYKAIRLWQEGKKEQAVRMLKDLINDGKNTIESCKPIIDEIIKLE